jgi:hypothetical protein
MYSYMHTLYIQLLTPSLTYSLTHLLTYSRSPPAVTQPPPASEWYRANLPLVHVTADDLLVDNNAVRNSLHRNYYFTTSLLHYSTPLLYGFPPPLLHYSTSLRYSTLLYSFSPPLLLYSTPLLYSFPPPLLHYSTSLRHSTLLYSSTLLFSSSPTALLYNSTTAPLFALLCVYFSTLLL